MIQSKKAMPVILCYSKQEIYGRVSEHISNLIQAFGFSVTQMYFDDLRQPIAVRVRKKLKECLGIFFLVAPEIRVNARKKRHTCTSGDYRHVFSTGKHLALFCEASVRDVGIFSRIEPESRIDFNVNAISESIASTIQMLDTTRRILTARKEPVKGREPTHILPSVQKTVMILENGHGIIQSSFEVLVLSPRFKVVKHNFGFNDLVDPKYRVPTLRTMTHNSKHRFAKASFSHRLLAPIIPKFGMKVTELARSTNRRRHFKITFSKPMSVGQTVKYAWGWSHPQLFDPSGKDATTYEPDLNIAQFTLRVRFEQSTPASVWKFKKEPILIIKQLGGLKTGELPATVQSNLYSLDFIWGPFPANAGSTYVAGWESERKRT